MSRRALLIGNTYYGKGSSSKLYALIADIGKFENALRNKCNFQIVDVLINRTHAEVCWSIEQFYRQSKREDLTLLYFSGRVGKNGHSGRPYLMASNTDSHLPYSTGIDKSFIPRVMADSRAQRHIVILDCWNSGVLKDSYLSKSLQGIAVFTSSSGSQLSRVDVRAHLQFTRYLTEGVQKPEADQNKDGIISIQELFDYAKRQANTHNSHCIPSLTLNNIESSTGIAKLAEDSCSDSPGSMGCLVVFAIILIVFFLISAGLYR